MLLIYIINSKVQSSEQTSYFELQHFSVLTALTFIKQSNFIKNKIKYLRFTLTAKRAWLTEDKSLSISGLCWCWTFCVVDKPNKRSLWVEMHAEGGHMAQLRTGKALLVQLRRPTICSKVYILLFTAALRNLCNNALPHHYHDSKMVCVFHLCPLLCLPPDEVERFSRTIWTQTCAMLSRITLTEQIGWNRWSHCGSFQS